MSKTDAETVAALTGRVAALESTVAEQGRLLAKLAYRAGLIPTVDAPAAVSPMAAKAAAGIDPIKQFATEARRHVAAGRSWDQFVDLIPADLFQAASRDYSLTVGKGNGTRSVAGFREHVMGLVTREGIAA